MSVVVGLDVEAERADFAGLGIEWDARVLRPRPWTAEQGRWAAELAPLAPAGPILELCCGAGHIGLVAATTSGRPLVQVDRDPVAAAYARRNAAAAGVVADVRCAPLDRALADEELFGIVIADPPWLPSEQVGRFPDDPLGAIDGGADGCDVVRSCLEVGLRHLAPGGHLLLQVGDTSQLAGVVEYIARLAPEHTITGVRDFRVGAHDHTPDPATTIGGILVDIGPSTGSQPDEQDQQQDQQDQQDQQGQQGQQEGQVSEVSNLADAGEPITPGDSVAGHPHDTERGERIDEGATGPEAPTGNQDTEAEPR